MTGIPIFGERGAVALHAARPRVREGEGRGRLPRYPRSRIGRWLVRFGFSAPFILLTLLLGRDERYLAGTANGALVQRVHDLRTLPLDVDLLAALYPPIPTLIAVLLPGSAVVLGLAGSLVTGWYLHRVLEWLRRRRLSVTERVLLVAVMAATPLLAYLVSTNLPITLGIAFFGAGMIDLFRFIVFANTQAGFRVGLFFAVAALSAPAFLFSVVIAACVSPFLVHSRRGAGTANALVLVFPTFVAFFTVWLLGVVFRGDLLFMIDGSGLRISPERLDLLAGVLAPPWGWLFFVPTVAGSALALIMRRPLVALVPPLLTGSVLLMSLLGVTPKGSSGTSFLILIAIVIAFAPHARRGWQRAATLIVVASQFIVGWAMALLIYAPIRLWLAALTTGGVG